MSMVLPCFLGFSHNISLIAFPVSVLPINNKKKWAPAACCCPLIFIATEAALTAALHLHSDVISFFVGQIRNSELYTKVNYFPLFVESPWTHQWKTFVNMKWLGSYWHILAFAWTDSREAKNTFRISLLLLINLRWLWLPLEKQMRLMTLLTDLRTHRELMMLLMLTWPVVDKFTCSRIAEHLASFLAPTGSSYSFPCKNPL